jgi:hypothetical protein
MRLALIVICVLLMSVAGLSAHNEKSIDIAHTDWNRPYGWDSHRFFDQASRDIHKAGIVSQRGTTGNYLFDDCFFNRLHAAPLSDHPAGEVRWSNFFEGQFFEGQSNQLVEAGVETKYARLEFLSAGADKETELNSNPNARNSGYDKLIIWLKNVYRAWVSEGHSGSTRLLLLSFGLVGIIGIRRKLKKKP